MKNTSPSPSSFYTPDNYRPQGSVAYLMLRNKSSYQRLGDLRLADLGITAAQMSVLLLVSHSEAATISSLSQALGVNAAATVRVVLRHEDGDLQLPVLIGGSDGLPSPDEHIAVEFGWRGSVEPLQPNRPHGAAMCHRTEYRASPDQPEA